MAKIKSQTQTGNEQFNAAINGNKREIRKKDLVDMAKNLNISEIKQDVETLKAALEIAQNDICGIGDDGKKLTGQVNEMVDVIHRLDRQFSQIIAGEHLDLDIPETKIDKMVNALFADLMRNYSVTSEELLNMKHFNREYAELKAEITWLKIPAYKRFWQKFMNWLNK